jgi:hypothetical protein
MSDIGIFYQLPKDCRNGVLDLCFGTIPARPELLTEMRPFSRAAINIFFQGSVFRAIRICSPPGRPSY